MLTIGFIDNLSNANNFAFVITNRHGEDDVGLIASLVVDFAVEARIFVCVFYVDDLFRFGYVTGDSDSERND